MDRRVDQKSWPVDTAPQSQILAPEAPGALAESAAILEQTREVQSEQIALIEGSPLALQYSAALTAQIEAKHDQAERIESKLDLLLQRQSAALQRTQSMQPGIFSLPGTRARWHEQLRLQQDVMQWLHGRLEMVREIKDGMGFHAPRIEELAARKVRAQEPELVDDWHEALEAQRRHQALLRNQEKTKREALERERRSRAAPVSLSLGQAIER